MIISEERCPGVYGKWAHVNQCRTDLEGALGCLIYCLSTSLKEKKNTTKKPNPIKKEKTKTNKKKKRERWRQKGRDKKEREC